MTVRRVTWTKRSENIAKRGGIQSDVGYYGEALPPGHIPETIPEGDEENEENLDEAKEEEEEEEEDASDDNEEEEQEGQAHDAHDATRADDPDEDTTMLNSCDLLWQGIVPRRLFHGFRFQVSILILCRADSPPQECRTSGTARKVLEAKGIAHYWDMAIRADHLISADH